MVADGVEKQVIVTTPKNARRIVHEKMLWHLFVDMATTSSMKTLLVTIARPPDLLNRPHCRYHISHRELASVGAVLVGGQLATRIAFRLDVPDFSFIAVRLRSWMQR